MQEKDRDYDVLLSVLIVGNTGVGKTCLAVRYAKGSFASDETPTNETSYIGPVFQDFGKRIRLQLNDTGGPEQLGCVTSSNYSGVQGVLIAFDITDMSSFENVTMWLKELERYTRELPKVIVGTKSDLNKKRAVGSDAAEEMATENGAAYLECSAKENTNVAAVFQAIGKAVAAKILGDPKKKKVAGDDGTIVVPASALMAMEKKRCIIS